MLLHQMGSTLRSVVGQDYWDVSVNSDVVIQEFNKGIFDYLIAADCKADGEENAETKPRPSRSTSRKRKREHDDEFGVTRGVDFKGVETVVVVDAPDTFDE